MIHSKKMNRLWKYFFWLKLVTVEIASYMDFELYQMDVYVTLFKRGLDEKSYTKQLEGPVSKRNEWKIHRLKYSIYELK